MKVNNSRGECLTISLRGLIYDGGSNMHIKHISRLFILLQTRLKTWTLMNILHFEGITDRIVKSQDCGRLVESLVIWYISFSWELFILEVACLQDEGHFHYSSLQIHNAKHASILPGKSNDRKYFKFKFTQTIFVYSNRPQNFSWLIMNISLLNKTNNFIKYWRLKVVCLYLCATGLGLWSHWWPLNLQ